MYCPLHPYSIVTTLINQNTLPLKQPSAKPIHQTSNNSFMNLQLNDSIRFDAMKAALTQKFPAYEVELKKNPLARFEYIQVRKSPFVGVWIRIFPKKNRVTLIKTIPSTWARAFLGGLLTMLFAGGAQGRLRKEVAGVLAKEFYTTELN